ncbi:hypothetical protein F4780DRAFT_485916 [Xylariomycetidae sp. FL0641]|nr:hypothetical protein F4780DRAFT_485916 [Xylariomycetidae sp. FL0641]
MTLYLTLPLPVPSFYFTAVRGLGGCYPSACPVPGLLPSTIPESSLHQSIAVFPYRVFALPPISCCDPATYSTLPGETCTITSTFASTFGLLHSDWPGLGSLTGQWLQRPPLEVRACQFNCAAMARWRKRRLACSKDPAGSLHSSPRTLACRKGHSTEPAREPGCLGEHCVPSPSHVANGKRRPNINTAILICRGRLCDSTTILISNVHTDGYPCCLTEGRVSRIPCGCVE